MRIWFLVPFPPGWMDFFVCAIHKNAYNRVFKLRTVLVGMRDRHAFKKTKALDQTSKAILLLRIRSKTPTISPFYPYQNINIYIFLIRMINTSKRKESYSQMQLNDPLVLLHEASSVQLCVPVVHSSTSENQKKNNNHTPSILYWDLTEVRGGGGQTRQKSQ